MSYSTLADFTVIKGAPVWIGDAMVVDRKYTFTDADGVTHILEAPGSSGHGYELCKINDQWLLIPHYPRD
jgi:hypothetical protein